MAPVTQYVFAAMRSKTEHFTAGSHEWLPYSGFPTFPKQSAKQQFVARTHFPGRHILKPPRDTAIAI